MQLADVAVVVVVDENAAKDVIITSINATVVEAAAEIIPETSAIIEMNIAPAAIGWVPLFSTAAQDRRIAQINHFPRVLTKVQKRF